MTTKPLFAIGDTVYHTSTKRYGIVKDVFESEPGFRYYVKHSGWTWSIPEDCLKFKNSQKNPESDCVVLEGDFTKMPQDALNPILTTQRAS